MPWNWRHKDWPQLRWDQGALAKAEALFAEQAGVLIGASEHFEDSAGQSFAIQLMTSEAYDS